MSRPDAPPAVSRRRKPKRRQKVAETVNQRTLDRERRMAAAAAQHVFRRRLEAAVRAARGVSLPA